MSGFALAEYGGASTKLPRDEDHGLNGRPEETYSGAGPLALVALGVSLVALGAAVAYLESFPPLVGMDDANIGFRYVRNLAEGHGFVFNPGDERVEGATSLLWIFLLTAVYAIGGAGALEPVGIAMSVLLAGGAVAIVLDALARFPSPGRWAGVAWLASLAAFYDWAGLALMDVAAWCAALHLLFLVATRNARPLWIVGSVLILVATRPDALLVVPSTALALGLAYGLTAEVRRTIALTVIPAVAMLGGLTLFRMSYFGYPLPNTYYTKVSPDLAYRLGEGLRYAGSYFVSHPVSLVPLAATLLLIVRVRGRVSVSTEGAQPRSEPAIGELDRVALAAGLFVGIGFTSAVVVGGDHFVDHRLLQPYLPLGAIPVAWAALRVRALLPASVNPRAAAVVTILLACLFVLREWRVPAAGDIGVSGYLLALEGRLIGEILDDEVGDDAPVVGVWQAGGIGYGYRGPVRDILGLNWVAMGHSPGDRKGVRDHAAFHAPTFWADPPDLMIPVSLFVVQRTGCPRRIWEDVLGGILTTDRFEEEFEPVVIGSEADGTAIFAYGRTAWLETSDAALTRVGWTVCGTG